MQLTNKKLIKSYKAILTSSLNAKSILESEVQKVDEKYKLLAEQEKKDISEQLKALDAQIDMYNKLIGEPECPVDSEDTVDTSVEEAPVVEDKVVDTLFPENNQTDEEAKDESEKDVDTEEDLPKSDVEEVAAADDWETPTEAEAQEDTVEEETTEPVDTEEWPDMPEEWK